MTSRAELTGPYPRRETTPRPHLDNHRTEPWREFAIIYTAALLGQFPLTAEEAEQAVALLELEPADAALLTAVPLRGQGITMPPTDPLIYRFYELIQNYGLTWKELIHEEFGDGIMSAIDFNMQMSANPTRPATAFASPCQVSFLPYKRYERAQKWRADRCPKMRQGATFQKAGHPILWSA